MKLLVELVLVLFLITLFRMSATSQITQATSTPQATPTPALVRANADETFELNISERRFTREDFEASTAVGTEGDQGLNLQIGVGLTAGRIDVLLRNVQGRVRFHGTINRIMQILSNRRPISPEPSP